MKYLDLRLFKIVSGVKNALIIFDPPSPLVVVAI